MENKVTLATMRNITGILVLLMVLFFTSEASARAFNLEDFIEKHKVSTVEEFIEALPTLYKQRFVMVYDSEAAAKDHVSSEHPRIISFGADGRMVFAWNTDPDAPTSPTNFRDAVEFLQQKETEWRIGVIDFSRDTPFISEPESCTSCHGPLNKPLWGAYLDGDWAGTEYIAEYPDHPYSQATREKFTSEDPRISPLDFSASEMLVDGERRLKRPGRLAYLYAIEEPGNLFAWRHAEVLFNRLKERQDFREFAEDVVCSDSPQDAVLEPFTLAEMNPAVLANTGEAIQGGSVLSALVAPNYHHQGGSGLGDAVVFLVLAELWEQEPAVRNLYKETSNADTMIQTAFANSMLYYPIRKATAEEEMTIKLRLHFGKANERTLDKLAQWNTREIYILGAQSGNFRTGHTQAMAPLVCEALRDTQQQVDPPVTAQFLQMPETHGGQKFSFKLKFSEEVDISFRTLRDIALKASGGSITGARRLAWPSDRDWEIRVKPRTARDITVTLRAVKNCKSRRAICTRDGRPLSATVRETIRGLK